MDNRNYEVIERLGGMKSALPAFNIPHLPIMAPVVQALTDMNSFGFIAVARCEWEKFSSGSMKQVRDTYDKCCNSKHVTLHLDHVPVIDEDDKYVNYIDIIKEAIDLGYQSVMIDGSRLSLDENIAATAEVVQLAAKSGLPVEGELGSVFGHESGPIPPYEELFKSGKGFTDVAEACRFVTETGVSWLSVAIGNIHGAISAATKNNKKVAARLHIGRLKELYSATECPLVLHGGSGIPNDVILDAVQNGITKINIGTVVRQAYESNVDKSQDIAEEAVYNLVIQLIKDMKIENTAQIVNR